LAACLEDAEEKPQNPDEDPEGQQGQVHYQADEDPDAHDGEEYEPQQHEGREDQPGEYHHFPFNITCETHVNKNDSATETIFKVVHVKTAVIMNERRDPMYEVTGDSCFSLVQ